MIIRSSIDLNTLLDDLGSALSQSSTGFFEKDVVLVQSKAMSKWIQIRLAEVNGLAAQIEFPFLRNFIARVLVKAGYTFEESFWSREVLLWRIYSLLPSLKHPHVQAYLSEGGEQKRYQLSLQLSNIYDEYMLYRPDWLETWESKERLLLKMPSEFEQWQGELWRLLVAQCPDKSVSFNRAMSQFIQNPKPMSAKELGLPQRVSIFGVTSMPPIFVTFFEALAEQASDLEICFYYLTPCVQYWGDLRKNKKAFSRRQQIDTHTWTGKSDVKGDELLRSWGSLGRDFLNTLLNHSQYNTFELDSSYQVKNNLNHLQHEMFYLEPSGEPKLKRDSSIEVQACHGALRELEVLKDHLYKLMEWDADLKPIDIVVLCPNLQDYAPYIPSVFDLEPGQKKQQKLTYSISDRALMGNSPMVHHFMKFLGLGKTRLQNLDVLSLLENPSVQKQFAFSIEDLELIREWVWKAGIRWGENSAHKKDIVGGGPDDFTLNSWSFGLTRLMHGVAFDEGSYYDDSLSCAVGQEGLLLGKFKTFCELVFKVSKQLQASHSTQEWLLLLNNILDDFFAEDHRESSERRSIQLSIASLGKHWRSSGLDEALGAEQVLHRMKTLLSDQISTQGYLNGGITFCSLLPMRSIPTKVVCVLGVNEGSFPRVDQGSNFDLMQENWRQGDRSANLDDRYLFLEAFLSARDHFYVSYQGFDSKDNSSIPPSVILTELMEVLKERIEPFSIRRHPMQAYSRRYFETKHFMTYSQQNYKLSKALMNQERGKGHFCESPLPLRESPGEVVECHLIDLQSFYKHPARAFLNYQFNTRLYLPGSEHFSESEAFDELDALELYQLNVKLYEKLHHWVSLHARYSHGDPQKLQEQKEVIFEELRKPFLALGELPFGHEGDKIFTARFNEVFSFYVKELSLKQGQPSQQVELDEFYEHEGQRVRVLGFLMNLYEKGFVFSQLTKLKDKKHYKQGRLLEFVIPYLFYCASGHRDKSKLVLQFADVLLELEPIEQGFAKTWSKLILSACLDGYQMPMPFMPKALHAFHKCMVGKDVEMERQKGFQKARESWYGNPSNPFDNPDDKDEAYAMCFGSQFPGEDDFFAEDYFKWLDELHSFLKSLKFVERAL